MDQILNDEQKYLTFVISEIEKKVKIFKQKEAQARSDGKKVMDTFFDDFSVNMSDYSEQLETSASIHQQQQILLEKNNAYERSARELATLNRVKGRPFFGRIDFEETAKTGREKIYIGMSSFVDTKNKYLIYDWRAPVSSIYYDGRLGEVSYDTPDGKQVVDLKLKRQFLISDGQVHSYFDTKNETIGDQMLLEALQEKSSTQMKTIVTTIQREQNAIIRDTKTDLLFVQGSAGSGKTSAVMQRMAFLLYRYRGNLNSTEILMFSPNQLFNDYIANVLPEMGENNMVRFTLETFVGRRIPGFEIINVLDSWEGQFNEVSRKVVHLLGSDDFYTAMETYAEKLNRAGVKLRPIVFRGQELVSTEKISQIFYQFNQNYKLLNRLDETKKRVLNLVKSNLGRQKRSDWVSNIVESMSEEQIRELNPRNREFASSKDEYNFYANKIIDHEYKILARKIVHNYFLNIMAQYRDFLLYLGQNKEFLAQFNLSKSEWKEYLLQVGELLSHKQMTINEALPFVQLFDLLTGRHGERDIRYVFIDEIQDYTPYQIRYLKHAFPRARFTLLGDLNQEIFSFDEGKYLIDEVKQIFKNQETKVVYLPTSYRSTKQITNFTKEILSDSEHIKAFDRNGLKPRVFIGQNHKQLDQKVVEILQNEHQQDFTTAVITKTPEAAEKLAATLTDLEIDHLLIKSARQHLAKKVMIIPAYLAKGLEFDAVIAYDVSKDNFTEQYERKLLYTVCSRAMHELSVLAVKEMSPLLEKVPESLYELEKL
ncbi:RNA polymerase recycling motor HelD [Xylocopilactobacillus apicola]|uniref:DNA helicase n=1 Tax=Xylocopilactobacillus apicola TaxID=2932184 RepID=A0AAU9D6C0_9LACO|nr:RNA polymerase recycling motor HelD [Xylocopilactobacillus apicola]BDR57911.1 DNA helicase [Xylocopilactobacillus apicola]